MKTVTVYYNRRGTDHENPLPGVMCPDHGNLTLGSFSDRFYCRTLRLSGLNIKLKKDLRIKIIVYLSFRSFLMSW